MQVIMNYVGYNVLHLDFDCYDTLCIKRRQE